jgi:hypothetical protein
MASLRRLAETTIAKKLLLGMINILQHNNKSTAPTTSEEEGEYAPMIPSTMKQTPHHP